MSFKASGPKTRPERVKPPSAPPTDTTPAWPSDAWNLPNTHTRRRLSSSSTSSTASFHSAASNSNTKAHNPPSTPPNDTGRFSPSTESSMLRSSHTLKSSANAQFAAADYSSALGTYDKARAELPTYLDYELAVLQSNIAACHVKLEQWKEAIEACAEGLAGLEREMPSLSNKSKTKRKMNGGGEKTKDGASSKDGTGIRMPNGQHASSTNAKPTRGATERATAQPQQKDDDDDDRVVELPSDDEADADAALAALSLSDARKADIQRIRTKLLLRRARARSSLTPPSWSHLAGALEDYTLLSTPAYLSTLPPSDQRTVRRGLVELPPRVNEAKEKEVGEMMGKLKDLGNGILKPFGLSTDMFRMVKDEKTGGYSMSFEQGGGGGGGGGGGSGK